MKPDNLPSRFLLEHALFDNIAMPERLVEHMFMNNNTIKSLQSVFTPYSATLGYRIQLYFQKMPSFYETQVPQQPKKS